jgi:hypothetical protein
MKHAAILIAIFSLLCLSACEKSELSRTGFNTAIRPGGSGQASLKVSSKARTVHLEGTLTLSEGQIELELSDPEGTSVYFQTISAPANLDLHESYPAKAGDWTLRYQSQGGVGTMDVHVRY